MTAPKAKQNKISYAWFPDSRRIESTSVSFMMYRHLSNLGKIICKRVFKTCLRVESRKIFTSLTNLRKAISVLRSVFPVNYLDRCSCLPSHGNYKCLTLPFQLSKNIDDVIPQATTLCPHSPKFKLSLKDQSRTYWTTKPSPSLRATCFCFDLKSSTSHFPWQGFIHFLKSKHKLG